MTLPRVIEAREYEKFDLDIDGKVVVRTVKGKALQDLFTLVDSAGFLDGEVYNGFFVIDQPNGFKLFHFFQDGSEVFTISLGANPNGDMCGVKLDPTTNITNILFVQNGALANEANGSLIGELFAVGGLSVVFQLAQDVNNVFELTENNKLRNTASLSTGDYPIVVRATGDGGETYLKQLTVMIGETAFISNIDLSSLIVEDTAVIGTSIGGLSTNGGEDPIAYTLISQLQNGVAIDHLEIVGNELKTKSLVTAVGTSYDIVIQAEDSRGALPDSSRLFIQSFKVSVVLNTFINTNSLTFDGVDEYMTAGDQPSMGTKTKFTICAWVYPTNAGVLQYMASKFGAAGQRGWTFGLGASGVWLWQYSQNGTSTDSFISTNTAVYNTWQHVAIVYDGAALTSTFYTNGVAINQESTTLSSLFNNNVDFLIGAIYNDTVSVKNFFTGNLDEMYFYDDALDATAIADIYNAGVPINNETLSSAATMVAGYRMGDDYSNGNQPDLKGNNDMVGVNMNNSNKSTLIP